MAARNSFAKKAVGEMAVKFTFAGGHELICSLHALGQETLTRLAIHGLAQKVGDSYAGAESVSEAIAAAETTWEALTRGEWTSRTRGGILAQAIADVMGKELDEVLAVLAGLDDAALKALKKDPRIAKRVLEIQASKLETAPTMDLGGLFK